MLPKEGRILLIPNGPGGTNATSSVAKSDKQAARMESPRVCVMTITLLGIALLTRLRKVKTEKTAQATSTMQSST
ncbi:hypothetical protein KIMH_10800 [Bombiscardovia apis]|uniref:Uncharacterized protein n=1 Tax=Bombiscardovia apis TaxID=2932182 RepID=A0ABN6SGW1_9BIFI|nr:hypothetical protein KIMH_10800 [Bombiscardovia apis]